MLSHILRSFKNFKAVIFLSLCTIVIEKFSYSWIAFCLINCKTNILHSTQRNQSAFPSFKVYSNLHSIDWHAFRYQLMDILHIIIRKCRVILSYAILLENLLSTQDILPQFHESPQIVRICRYSIVRPPWSLVARWFIGGQIGWRGCGWRRSTYYCCLCRHSAVEHPGSIQNTTQATQQSKPAPINSWFDKMSQVSIAFDKSSPLRQARGGRDQARGSGRSNAVLFSVYKIRPHAFTSCFSFQGWTAMMIILIIMCVAQRSTEGVATDAGWWSVSNWWQITRMQMLSLCGKNEMNWNENASFCPFYRRRGVMPVSDRPRKRST